MIGHEVESRADTIPLVIARSGIISGLTILQESCLADNRFCDYYSPEKERSVRSTVDRQESIQARLHSTYRLWLGCEVPNHIWWRRSTRIRIGDIVPRHHAGVTIFDFIETTSLNYSNGNAWILSQPCGKGQAPSTAAYNLVVNTLLDMFCDERERKQCAYNVVICVLCGNTGIASGLVRAHWYGTCESKETKKDQ